MFIFNSFLSIEYKFILILNLIVNYKILYSRMNLTIFYDTLKLAKGWSI